MPSLAMDLNAQRTQFTQCRARSADVQQIKALCATFAETPDDGFVVLCKIP